MIYVLNIVKILKYKKHPNKNVVFVKFKQYLDYYFYISIVLSSLRNLITIIGAEISTS